MKSFLRLSALSFLLIIFPYNVLNAVKCPHCKSLREDCLELKSSGHGSTGKWADSTTPKRGWKCTKAEDRGKNNFLTCEMCEVEKVRYVHFMEHGDQSPMKLQVGCICCAHMEGRIDSKEAFDQSKAAADERMNYFKSRNGKLKTFPEHKNPKWKKSKQGNDTLHYEGHIITIFPSKFRKGEFAASIGKENSTEKPKYTEETYPTILEAKRAAFNCLYPPVIPVK